MKPPPQPLATRRPRRPLRTYPILAIALTAGCSRAAPPERQVVPVGDSPEPPAPRAIGAPPEEGAVTWASHFQPPTDADGYPLVGNLVRKGGSGDRPDAGADGGGTSGPR